MPFKSESLDVTILEDRLFYSTVNYKHILKPLLHSQTMYID